MDMLKQEIKVTSENAEYDAAKEAQEMLLRKRTARRSALMLD
jgi:transcription elongation GreA/GreB family factor